jgi:hypothetical protein
MTRPLVAMVAASALALDLFALDARAAGPRRGLSERAGSVPPGPATRCDRPQRAEDQGEDADVGTDDRDGHGDHRRDDPAEMLIHAVGHVIEALADLAPNVGELAPKLAEAPVHVVAKGFQRAVGGIRATLEHRRPRWHVGGFVGHRARAYRSWRRAAMPCRGFWPLTISSLGYRRSSEYAKGPRSPTVSDPSGSTTYARAGVSCTRRIACGSIANSCSPTAPV